MLRDEELYKDWLELNVTKAFKAELDMLEIEKLRGIIVNPNREEACGIVKGITLVKSLLESAKEDGV